MRPVFLATRLQQCYELLMNKNAQNEYSARLAKALAVLCVRNTLLEDLHAGVPILSATGDYRDVKIITPGWVIPWNDASRITDDEMKKLMKQWSTNSTPR
jgi:hypothetical protein